QGSAVRHGYPAIDIHTRRHGERDVGIRAGYFYRSMRPLVGLRVTSASEGEQVGTRAEVANQKLLRARNVQSRNVRSFSTGWLDGSKAPLLTGLAIAWKNRNVRAIVQRLANRNGAYGHGTSRIDWYGSSGSLVTASGPLGCLQILVYDFQIIGGKLLNDLQGGTLGHNPHEIAARLEFGGCEISVLVRNGGCPFRRWSGRGRMHGQAQACHRRTVFIDHAAAQFAQPRKREP